ncbi:hypothetical protein MKW92_023142 [Papaver armeniacum]|nr:hypothetical protein MKW92_023142 [Papaver armeniacum]
MEFHPMPWRATHPYILVDRFEDVHIAGVGDFPLAGVTRVDEPPPLPHIDVTDHLKLDITEHINLDEETHLKKEIFRIGSYLKSKVCNVPSDMVNKRDPCQPILVGGISHEEQTVGRISARIERHSLHLKSLRTKEHIIVSVGWRRYLTRPIYAPEDPSLDFSLEDKLCSATFWGPFATPGTEVVAVQSLADSKAAFRILATGEVLGFIHAPYIPVTIGVETPTIIDEDRSLFNPLMTTSEPSDRIWTDDTKESEKSEAHVVWGSLERKIAAEGLREKMSKLQEEMLKLPCQKRKTDEKRRAVIILERIYFGNRAEFIEAYQKKKEEDIRNNINHGMPTRFFMRKTENTAVAD